MIAPASAQYEEIVTNGKITGWKLLLQKKFP